VTGTKQSDGSIKAVAVQIEDAPVTTPPTTPAPTARELSGIVSGLGTSACPVTTFTVGTTKVTTDASTTFTGGTCLQLKNTMTVEIRGVIQPDGSVKASLVNLEDAAEQAATEVDGAVSGLAGVAGCPVTAFTVGTTKVTTNAATTFTGGTCSQLANTVKVEVTGTKQADGSIKASRVNLEDVGDKETEVEVEVDGKISGLGSVAACPITTFTIGTTKVTTSGATEFKDGTCPQLANNLTVQVKGVKQTDGSLKAARVDFEKN